jgi:hypothetical protein
MRNWSNNPEVTRQRHSKAAKKHKRQNKRNLALGRGKGGANNRNKLACKRGHLFTEVSTLINADGARVCRICRRLNEWRRNGTHSVGKQSTDSSIS